VKDNLHIIANFIIQKPKFNSQSKEKLVGGIIPKLEFSDKQKKNFYASNVFKNIERLMIVEKASIKKLKKANKKNLHQITKLQDAYYAGSDQWQKCILIITEGDSAKTFVVSGLQQFNQNSQKYIGIYTLGGKFVNVKN